MDRRQRLPKVDRSSAGGDVYSRGLVSEPNITSSTWRRTRTGIARIILAECLISRRWPSRRHRARCVCAHIISTSDSIEKESTPAPLCQPRLACVHLRPRGCGWLLTVAHSNLQLGSSVVDDQRVEQSQRVHPDQHRRLVGQVPVLEYMHVAKSDLFIANFDDTALVRGNHPKWRRASGIAFLNVGRHADDRIRLTVER